MEAQQKNIDEVFRELPGRYQPPAPSFTPVWDKVAAQLDAAEKVPSSDRRRLPGYWPWIMLGLLLLVGLSWYLVGRQQPVVQAGADITAVPSPANGSGWDDEASWTSEGRGGSSSNEKISIPASPATPELKRSQSGVLSQADTDTVSRELKVSPQKAAPADGEAGKGPAARGDSYTGPTPAHGNDVAQHQAGPGVGKTSNMQQRQPVVFVQDRTGVPENPRSLALAQAKAIGTAVNHKSPSGIASVQASQVSPSPGTALNEQEKSLPEKVRGNGGRTKKRAGKTDNTGLAAATGIDGPEVPKATTGLTPEKSKKTASSKSVQTTKGDPDPEKSPKSTATKSTQINKNVSAPAGTSKEKGKAPAVAAKAGDKPTPPAAGTAGKAPVSTDKVSGRTSKGPKEPQTIRLHALLGYEAGLQSVAVARPGAGLNLVWNFSRRFSLSLQPLYRQGSAANQDIGQSQAFQDDNTLVIDSFSTPGGGGRFLYNYQMQQSYDSIVVSGGGIGGRFGELSLPLLLGYRAGPWTFSGGPSLNLGGKLSSSAAGSPQRYTVRRGDTILDNPDPIAIEDLERRFEPSTLPPFSSYSPVNSNAAPDAMRWGYQLGLSYEWQRWLVQASLQQQLGGYRNLPESLQSIYSSPYFRMAIGYRLLPWSSGGRRKAP